MDLDTVSFGLIHLRKLIREQEFIPSLPRAVHSLPSHALSAWNSAVTTGAPYIMKKNMRRRRGAVLGLVAACTLVFVVLGIAFFFLAKIMGGGREVAHTTDSGILNVCKQALL